MKLRNWMVWGAVALAGAGCSRCGEKPKPQVDAGVIDAGVSGQAAVGKRGSLPATDLRTALFLVFPEFRATHITGGHAELVRTVTWKSDKPLLEVVSPLLQKLGYEAPEVKDGVITAQRPSMVYEARQLGDEVVQSVGMVITDEVLEKLIHSPAPIGTEHLSMLTPRLPGEEDATEQFELYLAYRAKPQRTNFLVRSLIEDLDNAGWDPTEPLQGFEPTLPDGGAGPIPTQLEVTMVNPQTGGRLEIQRDDADAELSYEQPLAR